MRAWAVLVVEPLTACSKPKVLLDPPIFFLRNAQLQAMPVSGTSLFEKVRVLH